MAVADRVTLVGRILVCAFAAIAALGGEARAEAALPDGSGESFGSRVTLVVPVYTRHFPGNGQFDDVAIDRRWSVIGGAYVNSFHRSTAFAGVSFTPVSFDLGKVRISPGAMLGVDLNGGYRGHDPAEPLLGALELSVTGQGFEGTKYQRLGRTGLALVLMPGGFNQRGSVPVSLSLTYRFGP
jgi:hypothetical protein